MYVNKNGNLLFHSFILSGMILLNYIAWFIGIGHLVGYIIVLVYLLFFLYSGLYTLKHNKNQILIYLFILMLLLVSALSPTVDWDARSIWLFHAKRIYFESSLFAQLDNYESFSHKDYPTLIPSFIASLSSLMGTWNELFPKMGATLTLIPPLLIIAKFINKQMLQLFFFLFLILTARNYIFNGYMDAILAIYLTSSILLWIVFVKLVLKNRYHPIITYYISANFAILGMVKNEGILMLLIIFAITLLVIIITKKYKKIKSILSIFIVPFTFIFLWKIMCHYFGIGNDLMENDLFGMAIGRASDLHSIMLIIKNLFYMQYAWIYLLFFYSIILFFYQKKISIDALLSISFVIIYVFSIFLIYLSTYQDLQWHLSRSAARVMMPITILLATMIFLKLTKKTGLYPNLIH